MNCAKQCNIFNSKGKISMKKLTKDVLKQLIEDHGHWLKRDCAGWENMWANLSRTDLSGADLSGANLSGARLSGANLVEADLSGANLSGAHLVEADLSGANLSGARLSGANLSRVNLSGANLVEADLSGARLSGANLSRVNLSGTNLSGADLFEANLSGAEDIPYMPIACPDTGAFIAWKKVNDYIVKLQIPEDAKRCSATTRKCRCDKALVLAIENEDGTDSGETTLINKAYTTCIYTVGEMVYPDSWDNNRWNERSHGIHFFVNRQEAVNW